MEGNRVKQGKGWERVGNKGVEAGVNAGNRVEKWELKGENGRTWLSLGLEGSWLL